MSNSSNLDMLKFKSKKVGSKVVNFNDMNQCESLSSIPVPARPCPTNFISGLKLPKMSPGNVNSGVGCFKEFQKRDKMKTKKNWKCDIIGDHDHLPGIFHTSFLIDCSLDEEMNDVFNVKNKVKGFIERGNRNKIDSEINTKLAIACSKMEALENGMRMLDETCKAASGRLIGGFKLDSLESLDGVDNHNIEPDKRLLNQLKWREAKLNKDFKSMKNKIEIINRKSENEQLKTMSLLAKTKSLYNTNMKGPQKQKQWIPSVTFDPSYKKLLK